ncbi:MAG: nitroreductase family deazaflavin-dependent oxidoreductase [Acidimicrobiia bacterium]
MAKEYRVPKTINRVAMWFNRLGLGRSETMTTIGRKSGERREVPISPIELDGIEYVVAPYGEVSWVHNVRSNPEVTLRSGSRVRQVRLVEVTDEAAGVVKAYWDRENYPRQYMEVPGDATAEDFASVAGRFPVFRIETKQ